MMASTDSNNSNDGKNDDRAETDAIVSVLLADLFEGNPPAAVLSASRILTKLLRNAASGNPKHGTIRLTNPKIRQHVVNARGALDVLGAAGFGEAKEGGEYLSFRGPTSSALINAICAGLETKIAELDPPAASAAASKTAASNPKPAAASKRAPSIPSNVWKADPTAQSFNSRTRAEFLSEQARLERVAKIKAAKRAEREQREAAKRRWAEDMEGKKAAARRREAAFRDRIAKDTRSEDFAVHQDVRIASPNKKAGKLPLARPFEEAAVPRRNEGGGAGAGADDGSDPQAVRRRLIQECMKDPLLTAKEKQGRVRELMRAGDAAVLAAAGGEGEGAAASDRGPAGETAARGEPAAAPMGDAAAAAADDDDDTKPAAEESPPPSSTPRPGGDDPGGRRGPAPPSAGWARFAERTPRCAGAEGVRDSSVFFRKSSSDAAVPKCLKRLFRELDGLKEDLPSDPNCSIWLRFDEETPQYIRAVMTAPLPGPTPYSGGLFAFDIYVPNDYPQTNPKVQLLTTGGGRVRFGPNLYADGKVCLSLLGTWDGPRWNPKHSSLYQVLISIQGLILGVEHPYYLEPGHGGWEGKVKEGDFQVTGNTLSGESVKQEVGVPLQVILYEDILRVGTARYAMAQPLKQSLDNKRSTMGKTGLEAFDEIVQAHFCENRDAILAEVRNWMSDHALGRNRSEALEMSRARVEAMGNKGAKAGTLQIDALQALLPKLEELLGEASLPQTAAMSGNDVAMDEVEDSKPTARREAMDAEEDSKPAARPEDDSKSPARPKEGKTEHKLNNAVAKSCEPASGPDVLEEKRRQMQEAAQNGDFILAGKLQEEVQRLDDLKRSMEEAAQQGDFIRAGRLQAQFKALTEIALPEKANASQKPRWTEEVAGDSNLDDSSSDDEGMDWNDDDGMGEDDGPPFGAFPHGPPPHSPGIYPPPGHPGHPIHGKQTWGKHSWGAGQTLAAPPAAAAKEPEKTEGTEKAAPRKLIPPERLCRLRIRLPSDKSVVEDFDRNDSLAEVYRRLEDSVSPQRGSSRPKVAMGGPLVPGGAFSQPLSLPGFTLLLARPKREFSLEMHGTISLAELNLAPSATLTVMRCTDRGVVYRGEVESRLRGAQGDAMDVEGLTYEGLVELTERVGNAAPKEGEAFLTLTTEEYEANTSKISPSTYLADMDDSTGFCGEESRRCPICLGSYDPSDDTPSLRSVTNCGHTMHAGCLQTWLRTNSACPLCKGPIMDDVKKQSLKTPI